MLIGALSSIAFAPNEVIATLVSNFVLGAEVPVITTSLKLSDSLSKEKSLLNSLLL